MARLGFVWQGMAGQGKRGAVIRPSLQLARSWPNRRLFGRWQAEPGPKTGPQAKVYNGAMHRACGLAVRQSEKRRRPTPTCDLHTALEAVEGGKSIDRSSNEYATRAAKQDNATRPGKSRPHSPKCTLFFPFRGLTIGANHTQPWMLTGCSYGALTAGGGVGDRRFTKRNTGRGFDVVAISELFSG